MLLFRPKLKTFFFRYNPWQAFWLLMWNLGEITAWPILTKNAVFIFSQMIGGKRKKIDNDQL